MSCPCSVGSGWDERALPVRAANFVADARLDGHPYNGYEEGGYLEWALPNILWFQDGRAQAFPLDFFRPRRKGRQLAELFRDWMKKQGVGGRWRLDSARISGKNMFDSPDWALVYWDDANIVYVRRDVEQLLPS